MPNLFLMVALFCLCLSWVWQLNDPNPDLSYSDVRQLILQEKVEELTVNDYTLTLKLREEVEGQSTIRYELYDFQYFYDASRGCRYKWSSSRCTHRFIQRL